MVRQINTLLDELPRAYVRLGGGLVPSYFFFGLTGVVMGATAMVVLALFGLANVSVVLSLGAVSCVVFLTTAFLRKRLSGLEGHNLFEDLFAVVLVAAALLAALGLAVLPHLDLLAVGLSVFLIFGRCGCLVSGCCYGRPAGLGLRYPAECGHIDPMVRRFPVQLVEIILWTALSATGSVLVLATAPPGSTLAFVLVVYGLARCFIERLRDVHGSGTTAKSRTVWLALIAIATGIVLADGAALLSRAMAFLTACGAAATALLIGARRRWLAPAIALDDAGKAALLAFADVLSRRISQGAVLTTRVRDFSVAAGVLLNRDKAVLSLSVYRREPVLSRPEAGLVLDYLIQAMGLNDQMFETIATPEGLYLVLLPCSGTQPDPDGAPVTPRPSNGSCHSLASRGATFSVRDGDNISSETSRKRDHH